MDTNNENIPNSAPSAPQTVVPMQTVNVASVNSRVGFAAYSALGVVWVLSYMSANVLYAILTNIFGLKKFSIADPLILLIAFAVPLVPLFLFSNARLNKMLTQDTNNIEDINFKKQVRRSLKWAVIIGVLFIAFHLYMVLNILFRGAKGDAGDAIASLVAYGSGLGFVAWYSWRYYNKMRS